MKAIAGGKGTIEGLKGFGTTYDSKSFVSFFNKEGKIPAQNFTPPGPGSSIIPTSEMSNIKLNGHSIGRNQLYAEHQANLIMKDGAVTVGVGRETKNDVLYSDARDLPNEPGKVGNIHTHPVSEDASISFNRNGLSDSGSFGGGPSPADRDESYRPENTSGTVVVDSKNIYILTRGKQIVIPTK